MNRDQDDDVDWRWWVGILSSAVAVLVLVLIWWAVSSYFNSVNARREAWAPCLTRLCEKGILTKRELKTFLTRNHPDRGGDRFLWQDFQECLGSMPNKPLKCAKSRSGKK
jgi:hypothetical protein